MNYRSGPKSLEPDINLRTERQGLEDSQAAQVERMLSAVVKAISSIGEMRDPYTAGHQRRVGILSEAIAATMGLSKHFRKGLVIASELHDIGKISVPMEILIKPGRLSPIEYEVIKTHAAQGYEVLRHLEFPWPIAEVAWQHHERMDGSGYPRALRSADILLEARIVMVADVVESMAAHRPYRPSLGLPAAISEIVKNRGKLYDAGVVEACIQLFHQKRLEAIVLEQ